MSIFFTRKGDSIIGVIVAITILSGLLLSITLFLTKSALLQADFEKSSNMFLIKANAQSIGYGTDTSGLQENEVFSLARNTVTKQYDIYTGSLLESGAYINASGDRIDVNQIANLSESVYRRIYHIERRDDSFGAKNEVIKGSVQELIK